MSDNEVEIKVVDNNKKSYDLTKFARFFSSNNMTELCWYKKAFFPRLIVYVYTIYNSYMLRVEIGLRNVFFWKTNVISCLLHQLGEK